MLHLVETFYSIQGEGRNAGRAAYFVRFAGCNLDCVFATGSICDTPWRKANERKTVADIRSEVLALPAAAIVVITGGEPTLAVDFDDLVEDLLAMDRFVTVETNGTTWRDSLAHVNWLTVSPKDDVGHWRPTARPDLDPQVLRNADEMRYVVTAESAEPRLNPAALRHYVSPAAITIEGVTSENDEGDKFVGFHPGAVERAIEIVQANPYFELSIQTHKVVGIR